MTVLFTSTRPLGRCENLTAVWDAYPGDKVFERIGFGDASHSECGVIVTDEFLENVDKPRQRVVMLAHGLTGGKLYGNDQPHGIFRGKAESTALVDWYVVSSRHGRKYAASASGLPLERCVPLGMPRTDAYFGKRKGDGGTFMADRMAYLYAPTFRAWYNAPRVKVRWRAIDSLLDDDEVLVVKRHMVVEEPLVGVKCKHIVEVGNDEPSTPYLIDCDVLVTDFSSILFDGYVLGKPSVLAVDRAGDYLRTRGMYMDYPSEYGSRCALIGREPAELVRQMREALENGMGEVERRCREMTAGACDGHSTERVVALIKELECAS